MTNIKILDICACVGDLKVMVNCTAITRVSKHNLYISKRTPIHHEHWTNSTTRDKIQTWSTLGLPYRCRDTYKERLLETGLIPLTYWHEYLDMVQLFKMINNIAYVDKRHCSKSEDNKEIYKIWRQNWWEHWYLRNSYVVHVPTLDRTWWDQNEFEIHYQQICAGTSPL